MIFVFLLLQGYKPKDNSRNNNWLNRHAITFVMNTSTTGKNFAFFEVTSHKHHKLIYISYNQRYSDNKYLNKVHNFIISLPGTLNCNK